MLHREATPLVKHKSDALPEVPALVTLGPTFGGLVQPDQVPNLTHVKCTHNTTVPGPLKQKSLMVSSQTRNALQGMHHQENTT
jgi:hypothetical protein